MTLQGARNEIFAMQPAPIQVSYMGFPGTTGASYIDYLVTDEVRIGWPHLTFDDLCRYCFSNMSLYYSLFLLCAMPIFIRKSLCMSLIATLLMIINRYIFDIFGNNKSLNGLYHLLLSYFKSRGSYVCNNSYVIAEKYGCVGSKLPAQTIRLWSPWRQIYICMLQPVIQNGSWNL